MKPIRLGVVGCGAIAQIQHLPNLATLPDEFTVTCLCDASRSLAEAVAARFHVPRAVSDYRELLASDVEAVLLCHTDPKTEVALAALAAGKHLLIEKPVCWSLEEADALIEAASRAGVVAQTAYMKVYDPAFDLARSAVARLRNPRFVQIQHFHTDNRHHLARFRLLRGGEPDPAAREANRQARAVAVRQAIGEVPAEVEGAFFRLAGSLIHDLYTLRHLVGPATRVLHTDLWHDGWGIHTLLEHAGGLRTAATWVELFDVRDFKETIEVCADNGRVRLSYPTGFARGILSTLHLQELDGEGNPVGRTPAIEWESPFVCELREFHRCIRTGAQPRTPLEEARLDVELIIAITRRALA